MFNIFWLIIIIFVVIIIVLLFAKRGNYKFHGLDESDIKYLFNNDGAVYEEITESKKNIKRSKGEKITCDIMEELFGKPFPRVRPNFLKNPSTNRNLELDCYNKELKLAVEYNGPTHYEYPNYTNQTKKDFISQISRDVFKIKRCEENGVHLIIVPYTIPYNEIKSYILKQLPIKYLDMIIDKDESYIIE